MLLRIFLQMGVFSKKGFKIILPFLLALGLFTLDTFDCQAQGTILWENNYGGSAFDEPNSIRQTLDGGYIIAGETNSTDYDVSDTTYLRRNYWVVKLDKKGKIQWENVFGDNDLEFAKSVRQTPDGGYIVAGYTQSDWLGESDYWLLRLDSAGNLRWKNTYGGDKEDEAYDIEITNDSNYIVAGFSSSANQDVSDNNGDRDYWVAKIDKSGAIIWENNFGGSKDERAFDILKTQDGGYMVAGFSESSDQDVSNNHGKADIWLVKLNNAGKLQWEKNYGGSQSERGHVSIDQTANGGYVVAGSNGKYWVLKLNNSGKIIWENKYGGTGSDAPYSIKTVKGGGYIVTGQSNSSDGDVSDPYGVGSLTQNDIWVIKLDTSGYLEWKETYGSSGKDYSHDIQQTRDSNFIIAGASRGEDIDVSNTYGEEDIWIVKIANSACPVYNNIQATACDQYKPPSGDTSWAKSGIYRDTFKKPSGCDSVLIVDLSIPEIDTSVQRNADKLVAKAQNADYQWLDCINNHAPVQGATEKNFNPSFSGHYAVEITKEGCSDTSSCYQVGTTSIQANEAGNQLKIFPNPARDELTIKTAFSKGENIAIKLFSLFGKEIRVLKTGRVTNHLNNFNLKDIASGTYLLKVTTEDAVITRKIILNK